MYKKKKKRDEKIVKKGGGGGGRAVFVKNNEKEYTHRRHICMQCLKIRIFPAVLLLFHVSRNLRFHVHMCHWQTWNCRYPQIPVQRFWKDFWSQDCRGMRSEAILHWSAIWQELLRIKKIITEWWHSTTRFWKNSSDSGQFWKRRNRYRNCDGRKRTVDRCLQFFFYNEIS